MRADGEVVRSAHVGPPLTKDECEVFAKEVEAAVRVPDPVRFDDLLRVKSQAQRVVASMRLEPKLQQKVLSTIDKLSQGFADSFFKNVSDEGRMAFLRL